MKKISSLGDQLKKYAQLIVVCAEEIAKFEAEYETEEGQKDSMNPFSDGNVWFLDLIQSVIEGGENSIIEGREEYSHEYTPVRIKPDSLGTIRQYANTRLSPQIFVSFPYAPNSSLFKSMEFMVDQFLDYMRNNKYLSKYIYIQGKSIKNISRIENYIQRDRTPSGNIPMNSLELLVSPITLEQSEQEIKKVVREAGIKREKDSSEFYIRPIDDKYKSMDKKERQKYDYKLRFYIESLLPYYAYVYTFFPDKDSDLIEFHRLMIRTTFNLVERITFTPFYLWFKSYSIKQSRLTVDLYSE